MTIKDMGNRINERHDILCLLDGVDFTEYNPPEAKLPEPLQSIAGCGNFKYLRGLGTEGLEIFYFWNPREWQSPDQMDKTGLKYYCLPNRKRIEHEIEKSATVKIVSPTSTRSFYLWERGSTGLENTLNLDVMFPDKWGHAALEILLRYAGKD